jgi:hypothetical protein
VLVLEHLEGDVVERALAMKEAFWLGVQGLRLTGSNYLPIIGNSLLRKINEHQPFC